MQLIEFCLADMPASITLNRPVLMPWVSFGRSCCHDAQVTEFIPKATRFRHTAPGKRQDARDVGKSRAALEISVLAT